MLENFSVDLFGYRIQTCDENLLQSKNHINIEICGINADNTVFTIAYVNMQDYSLKVYNYLETITDDYNKALEYVAEKLGVRTNQFVHVDFN